jgi:hypothetical protein
MPILASWSGSLSFETGSPRAKNPGFADSREIARLVAIKD